MVKLTYGDDFAFSSIDTSTAVFEVSRRNILSGAFKVVEKDDKVERRAGRLAGFDSVALLNVKPFRFIFARSSSKDRVVRSGVAALGGSGLSHDVQMHQTVSKKSTPLTNPTTERVETPELCKHMNQNAVRKNTMLLRKRVG